MKTFQVRLERKYIQREVVDVQIEAETEAAAMEAALKLYETDGDEIEDEWTEIDGAPDHDSITAVGAREVE